MAAALGVWHGVPLLQKGEDVMGLGSSSADPQVIDGVVTVVCGPYEIRGPFVGLTVGDVLAKVAGIFSLSPDPVVALKGRVLDPGEVEDAILGEGASLLVVFP